MDHLTQLQEDFFKLVAAFLKIYLLQTPPSPVLQDCNQISLLLETSTTSRVFGKQYI